MAAMMPSGQTSTDPPLYQATVEPDLIDPDDGTPSSLVIVERADESLTSLANLDELDDPLQPASTSDRTPLTGNIQSQGSRSSRNTQSYLNSAIPGEDRRAPTNTIDESVWETVRRDLLAVWEKMRQVLWPKYLLGGMLMRGGGGIAGDQERGEAGLGEQMRGLLGRWPDADTVLQGSMSEGLRDWDLW